MKGFTELDDVYRVLVAATSILMVTCGYVQQQLEDDGLTALPAQRSELFFAGDLLSCGDRMLSFRCNGEPLRPPKCLDW